MGYDADFFIHRLVVMENQKENDCLVKFLSIGKNNDRFKYIFSKLCV